MRGNSVVWKNKITKEDEEAPIFPEVIRLFDRIRREVYPVKDGKVFRWEASTRPLLSRWFSEALALAAGSRRGKKLEISVDGKSMKTWRKSFKDRIAELPFQTQMMLMRHKTPDVTLKHYAHFDVDKIGGRSATSPPKTWNKTAYWLQGGCITTEGRAIPEQTLTLLIRGSGIPIAPPSLTA